MKPMELSSGQGVRVKWVDSAAIKGWDYTSPSNANPNDITTLGLVVSAKPNCLVITTSLDESGGALDPVAIPWVAISQIDVLRREDFDAEECTELAS